MQKFSSLLTSIKKEVKQILKDEPTGHGYWHCYRVEKLALKINQQEKGNSQILSLAAWLHDIGVPMGRKDHHLTGAKLAKKILKKHQVSKKLIDPVVDCILKHRYSTNLLYKLETIEEKIIQDADNLDALGAIIIPRVFAHCGVHQIPIYDPNLKPNPNSYQKTGRSSSGINHFYEKLFLIPNILQTKSAKLIAKNRVRFLKTFLKQYLDEFEGRK